MATKKDETASFVIRFTQKIFETEDGEPQVQWRGHIRHVQGDDEKRFSEFNEAMQFIQARLANLTISAVEDKSPEEQKGILSKSFDLWKRMALASPKMVMETLKDPKSGVEHIQEQMGQAMQEQVREVNELFSSKIDADAWKPATKADVHHLGEVLAQLTGDLAALHEKVDRLNKKPK